MFIIITQRKVHFLHAKNLYPPIFPTIALETIIFIVHIRSAQMTSPPISGHSSSPTPTNSHASRLLILVVQRKSDITTGGGSVGNGKEGSRTTQTAPRYPRDLNSVRKGSMNNNIMCY